MNIRKHKNPISIFCAILTAKITHTHTLFNLLGIIDILSITFVSLDKKSENYSLTPFFSNVQKKKIKTKQKT